MSHHYTMSQADPSYKRPSWRIVGDDRIYGEGSFDPEVWRALGTRAKAAVLLTVYKQKGGVPSPITWNDIAALDERELSRRGNFGQRTLAQLWSALAARSPPPLGAEADYWLSG